MQMLLFLSLTHLQYTSFKKKAWEAVGGKMPLLLCAWLCVSERGYMRVCVLVVLTAVSDRVTQASGLMSEIM